MLTQTMPLKSAVIIALQMLDRVQIPLKAEEAKPVAVAMDTLRIFAQQPEEAAPSAEGTAATAETPIAQAVRAANKQRGKKPDAKSQNPAN